MRFSVEEMNEAPQLRLVYRPQDYAFDVEPKPKDGGASLLVNELQLEVDEDGYVLYAWGYCPHTAWTDALVSSPSSARRARLRAELPDDFAPGTSIRVNKERWPVTVNRRSGWIRLGETIENALCVEFAEGMVACLSDGRLACLWLRPASLPQRDVGASS